MRMDDAVCFHEAGHAVVGLRLGMRALWVDVIETKERGGVTEFAAPGDWYDLTPPISPRCLGYAINRLVINFAGGIAEERATARDVLASDDWPSSTDWHTIKLTIGQIAASDDEAAALRDFARQRAHGMVQDNETWGEIKAVALALADHRMLNGRELRNVIKRHRQNRSAVVAQWNLRAASISQCLSSSCGVLRTTSMLVAPGINPSASRNTTHTAVVNE